MLRRRCRGQGGGSQEAVAISQVRAVLGLQGRVSERWADGFGEKQPDKPLSS